MSDTEHKPDDTTTTTTTTTDKPADPKPVEVDVTVKPASEPASA